MHFSSIWPRDRTFIKCYHSGPEWTWEWWQWRGYPTFPKLQHYWNLTIKLFSVISRTLVVGRGLILLQRYSCWISITVLHFKIDHVSHRTHGGWVDEYIQPSYVLPNGVHHRGYLIFIIFLKWITFFGILLFYLFMSKFADRSWEWLEGSVFNCYYTEVQVRVLLFSLNCFTLFESLAWLYLDWTISWAIGDII